MSQLSDEQFDRELAALVEEQRKKNPNFDMAAAFRMTGLENVLRSEDRIAHPDPEPFHFILPPNDSQGKPIPNAQMPWVWTPTPAEMRRLEAVRFFVQQRILNEHPQQKGETTDEQ